MISPQKTAAPETEPGTGERAHARKKKAALELPFPSATTEDAGKRAVP